MQNKQAILQTLIDSDQLNKYFHADTIPQRTPLRIVKGSWYEERIHLTKFGQAVQFIENESVKVPYLAVLTLDTTNQGATISFRYRPEGIVGEARIEKEHMKWIIKSISIHEQ